MTRNEKRYYEMIESTISQTHLVMYMLINENGPRSALDKIDRAAALLDKAAEIRATL